METPANPPGADPVQTALDRLAARQPLSAEQADAAFRVVMSGTVPQDRMRALLVGLLEKGETPDEIAGVVNALRSTMRSVRHPRPDELVDTCGTGGGSWTTINISTAAAFVAAGAGVPVAKHGNRSHTSRSGSADVMEALGVGIEHSPERAGEMLQQMGLTFLFAPRYHPAMRHLAQVRRELARPTVMNLVGPLANPAGVRRQVIGVADPGKGPIVVEALARLGLIHAIVVHGEIGMDEISPVGNTLVWELKHREVWHWSLEPSRFRLATHDLEGLEGGTAAENAARIVELFEHPKRVAPALRAAVLLNAAAAVLSSGLEDSLSRAVDRSVSALESGRAAAKLEQLRVAAPLSTSG